MVFKSATVDTIVLLFTKEKKKNELSVIFVEPVEDIMKQQAYGGVQTFLHESIVRAITSLAIHDIYSDNKRYRRHIQGHEQRSSI